MPRDPGLAVAISHESHRIHSALHHVWPLLPKGLPHFKKENRGFPGGPVVKNLPHDAGDIGAISGLERPHMPQGN